MQNSPKYFSQNKAGIKRYIINVLRPTAEVHPPSGPLLQNGTSQKTKRLTEKCSFRKSYLRKTVNSGVTHTGSSPSQFPPPLPHSFRHKKRDRNLHIFYNNKTQTGSMLARLATINKKNCSSTCREDSLRGNTSLTYGYTFCSREASSLSFVTELTEGRLQTPQWLECEGWEAEY
jgi:hypothetical protein